MKYADPRGRTGIPFPARPRPLPGRGRPAPPVQLGVDLFPAGAGGLSRGYHDLQLGYDHFGNLRALLRCHAVCLTDRYLGRDSNPHMDRV